MLKTRRCELLGLVARMIGTSLKRAFPPSRGRNRFSSAPPLVPRLTDHRERNHWNADPRVRVTVA